MKKTLLALSVVVVVALHSSCKKDPVDTAGNQPEEQQDTIPASDLNMNDEPFPQLNTVGSHRVIAGAYGQSAETDGNGSNARFLSPQGLFVNTDGSILVADFDGNVRKLTHDTVATTIHIPVDPDGFSYSGGSDIASTLDGTIMVVGEHQYWLYTPDGISHYHGVDSHDEIGLGVDRDPSGKFFWYTDFSSLRAVRPSGKSIDTKPLYDPELSGFTALSSSNNGVKYFATSSTIHKYTKSGISARIFPEFTFNNIYALASTRDGFKVYVVDGGDIKLITNNSKYPKTITTILSGQDVGGIALSNSEKYLYYTSHNTVNKLTL